MVTITHKTCSECQAEKDVNCFSRNYLSKDGYLYRCKDCDYLKRGHKNRYKKPTITLTDIQCAYLAALIDGEGHLGMALYKRGGKTFSAQTRMVISLTSEVLHSIHAEYGFGSIYVWKNKNPKHKDRIDWKIGSNEGREVLPKLIPFLKIKKQQCELLIEYLALANRKNRTQEYRDNVMTIYHKLKKLNKRGAYEN